MIKKTLLGLLSLLFIVIIFPGANAYGQISGSLTEKNITNLGGNNYIVGTVFWPTGTPINTRMSIRLSSSTKGDILSVTDDRGKFVFANIPGGEYTLIIDGESDYEAVMQRVEVLTTPREAPPETYSMTIRLRERNKPKTKAEKPAVVDAANTGIPKRAMDFYEKAVELGKANDLKGAIEQLKMAVAEYPAFVSAFNELGTIYMRSNDLDKADEALQAALKIKPDAYEPLINRGILMFRAARFKEAEPVLGDAIKAKGDSAVAHYYLGRALNKLGRNDEAETAFLASLKLSPNEFKETHQLLAVIYLDKGLFQKVIDEIETYLGLVPTASDAEDLRKVIEQCKRSLATPQSNQ